MRSPYAISLFLSLLILGVYWYRTTEAMCPAPISYRIGDIDQSFDISLEEARKMSEKTEAYWEDEVGRELFVYDDASDFRIDFIFDERQATANNEETLLSQLDDLKKESDSVRDSLNQLQTDYRELSSKYEAKVRSYEERLAKYNVEVNQYNDRGGAPPDTFKKLEVERKALNKESDNLNNEATKLTSLAKEINRLGERGNQLVNNYNREVGQFNSEFGFSREFTQGDYQGGQGIHIYKFSTENELLNVLAHEFGHALGIGHVEGNSSLMYYLLENTENTPVLSSADLSAYYEVCGRSETFGQTVRRTIRGFLSKF